MSPHIYKQTKEEKTANKILLTIQNKKLKKVTRKKNLKIEYSLKT